MLSEGVRLSLVKANHSLVLGRSPWARMVAAVSFLGTPSIKEWSFDIQLARKLPANDSPIAQRLY